MSEKTFNYEFHGQKVNSSSVKKLLVHLIKSNEDGTTDGNPNPVCIWGMHGIGKTQLVETIAKELGYKFAYIAPAQFEEMGDLVGMPTKEFDVEKNKQVTKWAVPDFVPTEEGPGIFLIDDFNRADDRIIRGIMQLLQNYELASWKLPKGWQIVLTANPDGGDYSVTPIDDATVTRMIHTTMKFDLKEWARWADENGVDERVINFCLKYSEIIDGQKTTARSIVKLADSIKNISNLKENLSLVAQIAHGCVSEEAAQSFVSFINDNLIDLISPIDIINSKKWQTTKDKITKTIEVKKEDDSIFYRNDIASLLSTRLINFIINNKEFDKKQIENIVNFLELDCIANDIKMSFVEEIRKKSTEVRSLKKVIAHPVMWELLSSGV